jgi:hypothetical protein
MRELAAMRMPMTLAAIVMSAGLLWSVPGMAQSSPPSDTAAGSLAQAQPQVRRVRPRIHVQRIYPYRRYHSFYPLPYDVEYPGPNAKRACAARYVTEYRPSGTVVVPRMNCWWVRG